MNTVPRCSSNTDLNCVLFLRGERGARDKRRWAETFTLTLDIAIFRTISKQFHRIGRNYASCFVANRRNFISFDPARSEWRYPGPSVPDVYFFRAEGREKSLYELRPISPFEGHSLFDQ